MNNCGLIGWNDWSQIELTDIDSEDCQKVTRARTKRAYIAWHIIIGIKL